MNRRTASACSALFLAALLFSCGSAPVRRYYTLTDAPGRARFETTHPFTLRVKELAASPTYGVDQLVYRLDANEIEYSRERRWTERPQQMLSKLLRKRLRESGLVALVTERLAEKAPDFVLEGEVEALEEVEGSGSQPSLAHLALSLRLVRAQSGELVWQSSFDERRPVEGRRGRDIARALSELFQQQLDQCLTALEKVLAAQVPAAPRAPDAAPAARDP